MKKGFTLIELLAVIVILAIIALIATPIVLNIIDDSKKNASLRSAEMYLDAVEYAIVDIVTNKGGLKSGTYYILKNGNICLEDYDISTRECKDNDGTVDNNELKVEVKGEKPSSGIIHINGIKSINASINLNNKIIGNNESGELVYKTSMCILASDSPKVANEIGAKYLCDFGGGVSNFYILERGTNPVFGSTLKTDEVALILDRDYYEGFLSWCDRSNPNSVNKSCNADGLTQELDSIANVWNKLKRSQIGLPSAEQIVVADGKNPNEYKGGTKLTNSWLFSKNRPNNEFDDPPYGYWTSSTTTIISPNIWELNVDAAYVVYYYGSIGSVDVNDPMTAGVRPVVNLKL